MKSRSRRQFLVLGTVSFGTTLLLAACNLDSRPRVAAPAQPNAAGQVAAAPAAGAAPGVSAPAQAQPAPSIAATVPTTAAEGGHVMAPTTSAGTAHQAREPSLPPLLDRSPKIVSFEVADKNIDIGPSTTIAAWTFGGSVPGPALHVRQGDSIQFTLTNKSVMPHSMDFHAARTAPNVNYKNVLPNESFSFTWKANDPGVFMYHCGTAPILQHLSEGMYGAVVVDSVSKSLPKVDREFVIVQSEFYLTPAVDGVSTGDFQKASAGTADLVVFNGYSNQYAEHPIVVKVGEKIRVHLMNAGPNHFSAFHVVGTIFDHVWVDGHPDNDLHGIQTWTVAPGEGSSFDFTLSEPGNYPMVSHSFADPTKGAVGVFKAEA